MFPTRDIEVAVPPPSELDIVVQITQEERAAYHVHHKKQNKTKNYTTHFPPSFARSTSLGCIMTSYPLLMVAA